MSSASVRIDVATHEEVKQLAAALGTSMGATIALAVRSLRQDRIGEELASAFTSGDSVWLDGDPN